MVCAYASYFWITLLIERGLMGAIYFLWDIAPALLIACILLAVLPSGALYWRGRARRDLISLRIAGVCALAVVMEVLVLLLALQCMRWGGPGG
jgi:hypothetical protein